MDNIRNLFDIRSHKGSRLSALIFIVIAFAFAFFVRLYWVSIIAQDPSSLYDGEVMINTNDGYYYAEGAMDILGFSEPSLNSPMSDPLSIITAFLYKITPLSFESLILYMPAFFGALVVVPLLLLGREFGSLEGGFIAALLGSIAHSYYNRTMAGYYDSDMLILFFALTAVYFAIKSMKHRKEIYLAGVVITFFIGLWYYPNLRYIFIGVAIVYFVLGVIEGRIKDRFFLLSSAIIFVSAPLFAWYIKLPVVASLFALLLFFRPKSHTPIYALFAISGALFLYFGFYDSLVGFLSRDNVVRSTVMEGNASLHYFSVVNTIREAGNIPFELFANRISGSVFLFFTSLLGLVLLAFYDRRYLLLLPLLVLGYFALRGGLRFTFYAVPIQALGFAFLTLYIATFIYKRFKLSETIFYLLLSFFTILALYPNLKHITEYRVPTVFTASEVDALEELKKISSPKDFGLSWWDYGYPIRYYGDVNSFIDGGIHQGGSNYPVSLAFATDSQRLSSTLSKMYANYLAGDIDEQFTPSGSLLEYEMKKNGFDNPYDLLDAIAIGSVKADFADDIYFVLPYRMLEILPTVYRFSEVDLLSGEMGAPGFYLFSSRFQDLGDRIALEGGVSVNKSGASLMLPNSRPIPLKRFVTVENGGVNVDRLHPNSPLNLIYMKEYGAFLIVSDEIYDSVFIKLFVLEEYDAELFEPVIITPYMKIYKVRK